MSSNLRSDSESYAQLSACSRSRNAYRVIYPAIFQRSDWLALKLGWLLSPCLDAPWLVFAEEETFRGNRLEGLMREQAVRTLELRRAVAKCEKGAQLAFHRALERLRRLHRELIELAIGYADSNALCPLYRPPKPILFAFPDFYERCLAGLEGWVDVFANPSPEELAAMRVVIAPEHQDTQCSRCRAWFFPVNGHTCGIPETTEPEVVIWRRA